MLKFNEATHTYTNDGTKLISVTQLMKKHGLSPNYDNVNPEVLNRKAKYGTLIHKEIEEYIKEGKFGFTDEVMEFIKYAKENQMEAIKSETMVCNDIVAGTIDLLYMENVSYIADIKTTYTLHIEAVSWQLSIYLYLYLGYREDGTFEAPSENEYNEVYGKAFHFNKEHKLNVVHIPLKPFKEIEKLMDCERKGIVYKYDIETVDNELSQIQTLEQVIHTLNQQVEEAKKKQEEFKSKLIEKLKEEKLTTYENNGIKITLVQPKKEVSTIDTEKMDKEIVKTYEEAKKKYDAEAKKYTTVTTKNSKEYLKITIKENK